MAIVKMKKLRLAVARSQKEALLKDLTRLGCVEFSEIEDMIAGSGIEGLVKREGTAATALRTRQNTLEQAIRLLDKYAPVKQKLLSAKPELTADIVLAAEGTDEALAAAETILKKDDGIKRRKAELSRLEAEKEALAPWLDLELPLEKPETVRCVVNLGSFPAKVLPEDIDAAVLSGSEEAETVRVSADKNQQYVAIIAMREEWPKVQESIRTLGYSPANLSGMTGTPAECSVKLAGAIEAGQAALKAQEEDIAAEAGHRDELKEAYDAVSTAIAMAEAEGRFFGLDSALYMQGWVPAEQEAALGEILDRYDCGWETEEPAEEEYPAVPVKLKNNFITNGLNMVTEMYSLPAYGSVDPNPLMAPFFILFYGLMMADMGYGLLMIAAAVVALIKIKPRGGSLSFCQLLLWGGISTFIVGALTGGFFGDALVKIGELTGKPEGWGTLPALFSPLSDTLYVLIGAMALGLVHLNTGMVINVVKKLKRHQAADAFFEEGALWITLIGIVLYIFKLGNIAGIPVVLVLGLLLVFYGGSRNAKGFGKVTSIFGTLYNTATGWFGDILSYSRIMALMLAGSVIAQVFNTIGAIANNLFVFILIFIVGHALNFALNLLGCYVHDLRLQCLEYFGKFYEDGGKAFKPLDFKTKYYNINEY